MITCICRKDVRLGTLRHTKQIEFTYGLAYAQGMGIPKVKNATQFRESLYDTLKRVAEGEPHLITQRENDPVVLISQKEFNEITNEREVLRAIANGAAEAEDGKTVPHKDALKRLKALRSKWK